MSRQTTGGIRSACCRQRRQRSGARHAARALFLLGSLLAGTALAAPSSYSSGPGGLKVLYLLLEDLGYRVGRIFDARELGPQVQAAVLTGATELIASAPLWRWIEQGGRLIVAPAQGDEGGEGDACADLALGPLRLKRRPSEQARVFHHRDLALPPLRCVLELPEQGTLLAGEPQAALALSLTRGKGQILALAHGEVLLNAALHRSDLAVLLRRWLAQVAPPGAQVAFFEQHQETLLSLAGRANLVPLLASALLWLALLYWRLAPRFGDPSPEAQTTRRAFSQHARALGHLYQRQGAAAAMLENQYERFLARIAGGKEPQRPGQAGGTARARGAVAGDALARLLATRTGEDPVAIARLLARVQQAAATPGRVEGREAQTYYHLSRSLAGLQRVSAPRVTSMGGNRGRSDRR